MAKLLAVRFRIDFEKHCSIGVGKVELLEGIARTGSLSQAARDMHMSYRRAWLILEDMKLSFDQPVAHSSRGGRAGGGGPRSPKFGERLVSKYRRLEAGIQQLAEKPLHDVHNHVKATRSKSVVQVTSIKRKLVVE